MRLQLALKAEYFNAIRDGSKTEEYRLMNEYWRKRLEGKSFDGITLTLGYPLATNKVRRLERAWAGFTIKTITHPLFGSEPVEVYAIRVNRMELA